MKPEKSLVILGLDEQKKPHASRFDIVLVETVRKAAQLMGFRTAVARTPEARDLANKLVDGKIFASGRGLVPFVKPAIYELLLKKLELEPESAAENSDSKPDSGTTTQDALPVPAAWAELKVGNLCLAPERDAAAEGFWFAVVVGISKDGSKLTLRWRDNPKQANVTLNRTDVAILASTAR